MDSGSAESSIEVNPQPKIPHGEGSSSMGITKRKPKEPTKGKTTQTPTSAGNRFQCPRCAKSFSRIENLTRHQANHDEVAKFACPICRKRFTRSDLLNRHRRIHGTDASKSHVTQPDYASHDPRNYDVPVLDRRPSSETTGTGYSNQSPVHDYQNHLPQQPLYQGQSQDGYQPHLQHPLPSGGASTMPMQPSHGLTSLMEAALAPESAFTFAPIENVNPMVWDGFMRFGGDAAPSAYMGSYDADMSWTLDYLPSEGSPANPFGPDMMNTYDDFGDNPYQYQTLQYEQTPIQPEPADSDGEDEDTTDWPDKVPNAPTQPQYSSRVVPRLISISWQAALNESLASGLNVVSMYPHQMVDNHLRAIIFQTLDGSDYSRNEISPPEIADGIFPPAEVLDFFLRLYIRYVQPRFPVLHLPTFDLYNTSPLLLTAMMFLGCSHSATDRGRFARLFHDHLRVAMVRIQEVDKAFLRSTENILTYFLICLFGTWSGSKTAYEFSEGGRGILVTACRRARLLDCRPGTQADIEKFVRPGANRLQAAWLAWVDAEKKKRLGLSIYIYDCQYPALFNNQPYVSKAETTNCIFPCDEEFWLADNSETWKMIVGPADMPSTTYYLHALNCCLLRKWVKPPPPIAKVAEFGKTVLMYALFTHIFEWRQSCSMLNPTGLMGSFGSSSHDIGDGLRERRRWLVDGLDSFAECYQTVGTSSATSLLLHLSYVALDVSLSDMHLVAGRSTNEHDGNFAEENLRHWANSVLSDSTMSHVFSMLELAHHCLTIGTAPDASFEVAICLFTGGMVCWAYAKLRLNAPRENYVDQVRRASQALRQMGCWRMCSMFGKILNNFEVPKRIEQ